MKGWACFCRVAVGVLLLVAGAPKALKPLDFLGQVEAYRLVQGTWAIGIAFVVPWLEVFAGTAMILRRGHRGAELIAAGLLLAFILALTQAWARGLDIECGCFAGEGGTANYSWWIIRDLLLLAAVAVCWLDATTVSPITDRGGVGPSVCSADSSRSGDSMTAAASGGSWNDA